MHLNYSLCFIIFSELGYLFLAEINIYWCSGKAVGTWGKVAKHVLV